MVRTKLSVMTPVLVSGAAVPLRMVQTAYDATSPDLLKTLPEGSMETSAQPTTGALVINADTKYQEYLGFGGAFTEASAVNFRAMSEEDQAKILHLYFADPSEGGNGYTLGRIPMGSSDFSVKSYNFDNVSADMNLDFFNISHDEESGMLPLIRAAQELVEARGHKLNLFASPWSPPAWMKLPDESGSQHMTHSATPNGLDPQFQRPWAKYFSKFIQAYRERGVDLWGVTVQNEPEYAANWEACVYTPEFQAAFIRDHLGPVLHEEQPGVKIIGYDHNKDHVVKWAEALYGDEDAKQYVDGIGVHWYGGLNTQNLQASQDIAPEKFILATEACNCGGVVYQTDPENWWSRAEDLALDILEDLRFWSVGWTDWNLVLGTDGGPNHLGNLCDANIIADPQETIGLGKLIMQATYYFMGQFSRFIEPGSRQISVENTVQVPRPEVKTDDVIGRRLPVITCRPGTGAQTFTFDDSAKTLSVYGACVEPGVIDETGGVGAVELQMASCHEGAANQQWSVQSTSAGSRFVHESSGKCLTNMKTHGDAVGMDKGVDVQAAQLMPCDSSNADQTFVTVQTDGTFAIETPGGLCAQPYDLDKVLFDAVAFQAPDGQVTLVALNVGDEAVTFDLYDGKLGAGTSVEVPSHGIVSYVYAPDQSIIV